MDARRLKESWRRVSSTHNLQDLLKDPQAAPEPGDWKTRATGIGLMIGALVLLLSSTAALLVLKGMPEAHSALLRMVQQDWYYSLLVPIGIPVTVMAVALNWFSLKLFKHNS